MMISIALTGGSPGARPKPKTRIERADAAPEPEADPARPHAEGDEADHEQPLDRDQDPVGRAHPVRLRVELLAGARLESRTGELGIETGDLCDRLHAAGEHCPDRARRAGELLDRRLERVRFLVERVLRILELGLRRVGPVGDRLGRLLTLR